MGLTDISWPGLFIGVSATTYLLLGLSRPKPRRCAKPSRKPTLHSLRGRLMAGEWQGSSDGKVTGRGGLSILGFHPKPRRCAKPSRKPTLHSLRGRLMAGEWQGSSDGKVTGRGGLSILGLLPQTPALRKAISQGSPGFRFAAA